jgi:hypothetical protein
MPWGKAIPEGGADADDAAEPCVGVAKPDRFGQAIDIAEQGANAVTLVFDGDDQEECRLG